MKNSRKLLILLLISLSIMSFQLKDNDPQTLNIRDLPRNAVSIIQEHFPNCQILSITRKQQDNGYRVQFKSNEVIQFDESGQWTYINCHQRPIPLLLIPSQVRNKVAKKYGPQASPTMMCKFKKRLKLRLDNEVEVTLKNWL